MKTLVFILLITLTSIVSFAQKVNVDSIQVSGITGADTTLFISFRAISGGSIVFDFTNFDANDGILDIGFSNDLNSFTSIDNSSNPFTLDKTAITKAVNGVSKSRISIEKSNWNFKYLAIKLTKSSNTSGALIWQYVR